MRKKEKQDDDDFRKRREEYSIHIRRAQREETFTSRRGTGQQLPTADHDNIIDERYREQISKMISQDYNETMLFDLISKMKSPDVLQMHYGIIGIRKLLSEEAGLEIQTFIDAGLIDRCFQFINQREFPQLRLESVWALTNVASGDTRFCAKLVNKGAIKIFIDLLRENQKGVVDQAIWAIGNIAADQTMYRDLILKGGGLEALIAIVESPSHKFIYKNGIWAITNLCRSTPCPNYQYIKIAIPVLARALGNGLITSKQILSDCCWSLSLMSEGSTQKVEAVVKTGVLPLFFKYVLDSYSGLYMPSLRAIGNISSGTEAHTQLLINNGVFNILLALLSHPKKPIRREVCWILSNLAAGSESQVKILVSNHNLLQKIAQIFSTDVVEIRKQVCWIYSNIGHLGPQEVVLNIYLQYDIMRTFVHLLSENDEQVLESTLECLYKILLIGKKASKQSNVMLNKFLSYNGGEILEHLQHHQSMEVYEQASKILTKFFVLDDTVL